MKYKGKIDICFGSLIILIKRKENFHKGTPPFLLYLNLITRNYAKMFILRLILIGILICGSVASMYKLCIIIKL